MCLSLNNCCCCFTLKLGTKIISVIGTLSAMISMLIYGWLAILGSDLPPSRLLFYASMTVTAFVQCVFGLFFIYGAFAHKPKYTVPWTALSWSQSVALLALTVTGTALLSYNRHPQTTAGISTAIAFYFVYALIFFYFASVVNSRRQQVLVEERAPASKRMMQHQVLPNYYV